MTGDVVRIPARRTVDLLARRFPMPKRSAPSCGTTAARALRDQPLPGLRKLQDSAPASACHAGSMLSE